jgi:hypothetical protein
MYDDYYAHETPVVRIGTSYTQSREPDHRVWLPGEVLKVNRSPFGGAIYPYNAGMSGWAPQPQLIFNF